MSHALPDAGLTERPTRRSSLRVALRVAIGLALVAFIATRVDLGSLTVRSWSSALLASGAALGLLVIAQLLSALRWQAILAQPGIPLGYLLRLYLVGQCFGLFLPTSVGGDAVRIVALARETPRAADAMASVVLDRFLGVIALGAYLVLGLLLTGTMLANQPGEIGWTMPSRLVLVGLAAGVALMAGLLWLFRRAPVVDRVLAEIARMARLARRPPRAWARWIAISLLVQATYILVWVVLAIGMRLEVPLAYFLFAVPLVSLAAMAPVTISGLGIREGAWVVLLSPFGVAGADAVAFSLLYFLAFAALGAIGGLVFATRGTALAGKRGGEATSGTNAGPASEHLAPRAAARGASS